MFLFWQFLYKTFVFPQLRSTFHVSKYRSFQKNFYKNLLTNPEEAVHKDSVE